MRSRFQFSTGRLLLATAIFAVWVAVFANASQTLPRAETVPPAYEWIFSLCFFVAPTALLCAFAAVTVRTIGKTSIVAAIFGAVVYVAVIAWASLTWG